MVASTRPMKPGWLRHGPALARLLPRGRGAVPQDIPAAGNGALARGPGDAKHAPIANRDLNAFNSGMNPTCEYQHRPDRLRRVAGHHCRSIAAAPGARLAAVVTDPAKARAWADEHGVPHFTDYRAMFAAHPEIDAPPSSRLRACTSSTP